jgi:hypothetical protein
MEHCLSEGEQLHSLDTVVAVASLLKRDVYLA